MTTHKYLIQHGKHARWEDVDGVQTIVTRKPGDIIEMTMEQAQEKQQSVRLATVEDITAYEARLRGETAPPPTIPDTHVSTAGAPPAPTPAVDPLQPPATAEQPPARHFAPPPAAPEPVAPVPPVVPAAQPVVAPPAVAAPPVATPATPAAPPVSPTQRASDSASAKAENEGKPKARTGNKGTAKKTSGTRSRGSRK